MPLFAVHIADGVLSPAWAAAGFAAAGLLLALSLWRMTDAEIVRAGVFAAAFFVASQIHIPIGVASVHLLLVGVVGVVLRGRAPVAVTVGLVLQALLFGHGGLTALGANAVVLSVPAVLAGVAYRPLVRRMPAEAAGGVIGGGSAALAVFLNAGVLWFGGVEKWDALVGVVVLAHIPVLIVETLLTAGVVAYLAKVRPEWLT